MLQSNVSLLSFLFVQKPLICRSISENGLLIGSPGQATFSGGRETYGEGPGIEEQPIKNYISANRDSEVL